MKQHKTALPRLALIGVAAALAGCTQPVTIDEFGRSDVAVTKAAPPSAVVRYQQADSVLGCIKDTGRLRNTVFSVGSFADSTGKINSVAVGATGNFLPQGGSSAFVTDALRRAGAQVVSTYFGPPERRIRTQYAVNGIFNSLDFGRPTNIDARIAGVGPVISTGWAQLSLSIQLDEADTRRNRQMSIIQRPVRYQQFGISVARTFGTSLATGFAEGQSQERLQLEALNGPIALGVADVLMREFPELRAGCGAAVQDVLADTAAPPEQG
jgi:hypothetical protein